MPCQGLRTARGVHYGGAIFACRQCHQLANPTSGKPTMIVQPDTQKNPSEARLRARNLQYKGMEKPKGMHWSTFERLIAKHDIQEPFVREQQLDPEVYYPKGYHPHLLEEWPVKGDLVVPLEALPENLKQSMGESWRKKQKNLKILEEQSKKK